MPGVAFHRALFKADVRFVDVSCAAAVNCSELKSRLMEIIVKIGLFNLTETGLQIGLINGNEKAKIRILPFFNYSPVK